MSIDKEDERTPGPWYVDAQYDAPYIIDQPPRPATDDITKGPADLVVVARVYKLGDAEDIVRACNRYDKIREALAKLLTTAQLLLQNAEACAMNHHWRDFQEFGPPGWLADCENEILAARAALNGVTQPAKPMESAMTEAQIKHMVDRFLSWKLPENFNPDGGISFKKTFNENTPWPSKHEPSGTNLFNADEATAMVRHMLEGLPATGVEKLSTDEVDLK